MFGVVEGIVEAGNGTCGVAQGRVGGHVAYALAVDVDLAAITQGLEVFRACEGAGWVGDDVFGFHVAARPPPPAPSRKGRGRI